MKWLTHSPRTSMAVVCVLVLLLGVLATLQYRWIAQVSDAEQTRLKATLNQAAADFCEDFDREVVRAASVFDLRLPIESEDLPQILARSMRRWREESEWPDMVKDLTVLRTDEPNTVVSLCFDEPSQALVQCQWDQSLQPIRHRLRSEGPGIPLIDDHLPGLVLPIEEGGDRRKGPLLGWHPPRFHLVIRFNLDAVTGEILPLLTERHFRSSGNLQHQLKVSVVGKPRTTLFQTGPDHSDQTNHPDASGLLFGLHSFQDLSETPTGGPRRHQPARPALGSRSESRPHPQQGMPPHGLRPRIEKGVWILEVHHSAGSLEKVVASARRRNMAISLVILALLFVTALMMLVSTRRAQRLARQQMDFVATISHELRTPLTAIRSAGQNLAEGIISDPARVHSYGLLIEREGRRLTEMIGRVLAFAGIRSGRQNFRMAPVDLAEITEAALEDCRWILEEKDFSVDQEIGRDLPSVTGDAGALRLVVNNLIDNAIKYGAAGKWLGVSAGEGAAKDPREVWLSISDHGPGIPRREQRHLFEAFRRGADAAAGTVPGSGLGLAVVRGVVESHGGSIEIVSSPENGTTFTVRLPAEPVGDTSGEAS